MKDDRDYHEIFDRRFREVDNLLWKRWRKDEDVLQEARIGVYKALMRNPDACTKYLFRAGMYAAQTYLAKGKSIDNAKLSSYRKANGQPTMCAFTVEEWESLIDSSRPVDEQVIFVDCAAKYLDSLDEKEKAFIRINMSGKAERLQSPLPISQNRYRKELADKMRVSVSRVYELERSARIKWDQVFSE